MSTNTYQKFVNNIAISLNQSMRDSPRLKPEEWMDDARDIISMLRLETPSDENQTASLIENFYIEKEASDHFTDFKTPSKEVAKVYLNEEYL